jgi:hypothetical protein
MSCLPLIGVTACTKQCCCHYYLGVADKHLRGLGVASGALSARSLLLGVIDGQLSRLSAAELTPHYHRGVSGAPSTHHAAARLSSLSVIKAAIAKGVPLIAKQLLSPLFNAGADAALQLSSARLTVPSAGMFGGLDLSQQNQVNSHSFRPSLWPVISAQVNIELDAPSQVRFSHP